MRTAFGIAMVALLVVSSGIGQVAQAGRLQSTPVAEFDGSAESLLAVCPCQPTDNELFNAFVYPSDLPMNPAPDPRWTDEERRTEVATMLDERFEGRSPEVRGRAFGCVRRSNGDHGRSAGRGVGDAGWHVG